MYCKVFAEGDWLYFDADIKSHVFGGVVLRFDDGTTSVTDEDSAVKDYSFRINTVKEEVDYSDKCFEFLLKLQSDVKFRVGGKTYSISKGFEGSQLDIFLYLVEKKLGLNCLENNALKAEYSLAENMTVDLVNNMFNYRNMYNSLSSYSVFSSMFDALEDEEDRFYRLYVPERFDRRAYGV